MTHANITEQTIRDRIAAWGVPRRIAERPMREVVRMTVMSEGRLLWLLKKYRGRA